MSTEDISGDFEEVYGADGNEEPGSEPQSGKWDAILTCFFIDTVRNPQFPSERIHAHILFVYVVGQKYRQLLAHHTQDFSSWWCLD